jgi:hypothetical protein
MGREQSRSFFVHHSMFNFSANHLFLISRTEFRSCALLLMLDHDTRRVYRLFDFTKCLRPIPGKAYCVAGKVNSVNTIYLVVESIKLDLKHQQSSIAHPPNDGADG